MITQIRTNEAIINNAQSFYCFHDTSPPWDHTELQAYCDHVNKQHGSRGNIYQQLLKRIHEAVEKLPEDVFDDLSCNLLILIQKIPNELKERKNIKKAIETICFLQTSQSSLTLLRNLCGRINISDEIDIIYQEILELLNSSLQGTTIFKEFESIGRCLTLVQHEMPYDIKKEDSINETISSLEKHLTFLLETYCRSINKGKIGNPISAYQAIYLAIEDALQFQITIEELHRLSRNFMLTIQLMSPRHQTQKMQTLIQRIKRRLIDLSHLHFHPLKEQLRDARISSDVLSLQSMIELISRALPKEIDPKLEKEVEKCLNFSLQKFFTRSFVEHRQNVVGIHDNLKVSSISAFEGIESTRFQKRSIYPILSIDGGGIRGIIPATVLVAIENFTKEPIASLFQQIGGTSTGGILTLGLTKPHFKKPGLPEYSAQDLLDLYTLKHDQIFRKNPHYRQNTSGLKLSDKIKDAVLNPRYLTPTLFQEKFENSRMSSALTDVVITANTLDAIISKTCSISVTAFTGAISFCSGLLGYEPTSIWSHDSIPKVVHLFTKQGIKRLSYSLGNLERCYEFPFLRRYSCPISSTTEIGEEYSIYSESVSHSLMANVAKITSAAPTYFLPVEHEGKFYMDGGVLQNNPSIPCVLEALDRGIRKETLFILSLGTGKEPKHIPDANFDSALGSLWSETTQPHFQENSTLTNMLASGASYRFQYQFEKRAPELDDTSFKTINLLQESGDKLVEENIDQIREVCRVLRPDSI